MSGFITRVSVRVVDCVGIGGGVGTTVITVANPGSGPEAAGGEAGGQVADNRDGHLTVGWLASEAMRRTADAEGALGGTAPAAAHEFIFGALRIAEQAPVLVSSPRGLGLTSLRERRQSGTTAPSAGHEQAVVAATLAPRQIAPALELAALRLMCAAAGAGAPGGRGEVAAAAAVAAEAADDCTAAAAAMREQLRAAFACDRALVDVRTAAVARWLRSGGSEVAGAAGAAGAAAAPSAKRAATRAATRMSTSEKELAALRARYAVSGAQSGVDRRFALGAELQQVLQSDDGGGWLGEAAFDVLLLPWVTEAVAAAAPAAVAAAPAAAAAEAVAAKVAVAATADGCTGSDGAGGGAGGSLSSPRTEGQRQTRSLFAGAAAASSSTWPAAPPACLGSAFRVRCGPRYRKTGKKEPSAEPMYDVLSAAPLRAGAPLAREGWAPAAHKSGAPMSAAHVALAGAGGALRMPAGEAAAALARRWPGMGGAPGEGGGELLPPLFVVNFKMPLTAPAMRASSAADAGTNFVFVLGLREATRATLASQPRERWPAALRLLVDWVREAPADPKVSGRFKLITQIVDIQSLGLGGFIEGYNGKPVLITKSGSLHAGPGYLEMDADVHAFNVMARKTLKGLHGTLPRVKAQVGLVIQGSADEELPEQLLACCELPSCDFLPPPL